MRKRRPLVLGGQGAAHIEWFGKVPHTSVRPARRMVPHDLLEPPPDDLREAHLVFFSEPFSLAIETVWDLDLCFYHDGILPPLGQSVNHRWRL